MLQVLGDDWSRNVQIPATQTQDGMSAHMVRVLSVAKKNISLSFRARVARSHYSLRYGGQGAQCGAKRCQVNAPLCNFLFLYVEYLHSPTSVLQARKRRVCPVCTVQEDRPVMIEEGAEWDIHRNTKAHRRMASRDNRSYRTAPIAQNEQTTK